MNVPRHACIELIFDCFPHIFNQEKFVVDIRRDIKSLKTSVSQARGTVSDWNNKAEAIGRRIGRVRDYMKKNDLNNELESVVDMFREQRGIEYYSRS